MSVVTAKTKVETLREVTTSPNAKVDREAGVIHGVRVLGPSSLNDRIYTQDAVQKAVNMYEGAVVNVDHPQAAGNARTVADRFGWIESVRYVDGGLSGDLYFLKTDPRADKVCEAAERKPELFGLSHNVRGKTHRDGDITVVEEITQVISVDVVSDPATTKSLFESQGNQMDIAAAPTDPVATDPGEEIKWGFKSAVNAVLDGDEDKKAKLAKIKALLDAEEKATAALAGEKTPPPDEGEEKTEESLKSKSGDELATLREENKRLKDEASVRTLLESEDRAADPILVKALMGLPTEADRKALVESWPKDSANRPRSMMAKRQNDDKSPKNSKEFVGAIT